MTSENYVQEFAHPAWTQWPLRTGSSFLLPPMSNHRRSASRDIAPAQTSPSLASRVSRAFTWNRVTPPPPPGPALSQYSSHAVPDSGWCSNDLMFGAAMVIIRDNTHKIVVVNDSRKRGWFFPRGRKDVGESLEAAALREGYEESGYRPELMPHWAPHHAPTPPSNPAQGKLASPSCEPIFVTTMYWPPRYRDANGRLEQVRGGGQYLITWYLGRIAEDAARETGTGMPDEAGYEACLLSFEDAYQRVPLAERQVLVYAWKVYTETVKYNTQLQAAEARAKLSNGEFAAASTNFLPGTGVGPGLDVITDRAAIPSDVNLPFSARVNGRR